MLQVASYGWRLAILVEVYIVPRMGVESRAELQDVATLFSAMQVPKHAEASESSFFSGAEVRSCFAVAGTGV